MKQRSLIAALTCHTQSSLICFGPGGPDVYEGVPIDYSGEDVTAFNYLAVLAGRKDLMKGVGNGRYGVLQSG